MSCGYCTEDCGNSHAHSCKEALITLAGCAALSVATDWFPLYKDLDDKDYFIEAQVITPAGGIPYTNNNG